MKKPKSRRFANRPLMLSDVLDRFESVSASSHIRTAQSLIERLREEGNKFWPDDQKKFDKWEDCCNVLRNFIIGELGGRRFNQKQSLGTALREFIGDFEHSVHRMCQILYGTTDHVGSDCQADRMISMLELVYRASTYAIISFWIDEKHDARSTTIQISVKPDDTKTQIKETFVYKEMKRPKNRKHRRTMKKL